MNPEAFKVFETGSAALVFALIFLAGDRVPASRPWLSDRRSLASFSSGAATAYFFIHLIPQLHGARSALVESLEPSLRFEGMGIYYLALIGFLLFHGLDRWHLRARKPAAEQAAGLSFWIHVGAFAAYVGVLSYLLVNSLEKTSTSALLYALAIAFHLLALEHSLREQHGAQFGRIGRWLLATMALLGWGVGELHRLPNAALAMMLAFVSGAVLVNSAIMELPAEKDGRFVPFLAGGLIYGLVLVPFS